LYSGPTFYIHYKYSFILNFTFVTFIYGFGLPLLFPIAAGAMFVMFLVEKTMIYYSYRQPPTYDDKLNKAVLGLMTYAPILFLSFGYWMLSNHQLYNNDVFEFTYSDDVITTNHIWYSVFTPEAYTNCPSMPVLLTFWFVFFFTVFRNQIFGFITKHVKFMRVGEMELDENLPNYFTTLDEHDRNWSIKEEENCNKLMNFEILNRETLDRLRSTKAFNQTLQGIHSYDILANILYVDDF